VHDPSDFRLGDNLLHEFELGGASQTVVGGHRPDGAAVECESVTVARKLVDVGHVPLGVEDGGQTRHCVAERPAYQLVSALFDTPAPAPLKDAKNELGVLVLDVAEQLDREVTGRRSGEQGLAQFGAVVEVGRSAGSTPHSTRGDEPTGPERSQMLADRARGDPQDLRHFVG